MDAKLYNDLFVGWNWVPVNVTRDWKQKFVNTDDFYLPRDGDLHWLIWCGLTITVVRYLVERFVFTPIGRCYNLPENTMRTVERNAMLERHFKREKRPSTAEIIRLAKSTGWVENRVARWFHLQRCNENSSRMKKFTESMWKVVFISITWCYAVYSIYGIADWFYPVFTLRAFQPVPLDDDMFRVYMITLGWYFSQSLTMLFDVQRKDFYVMASHHVVTFLIIYIAWNTNSTIIGIQIVIIHDFSDILLELTKALRYLRYNDISIVTGLSFAASWFILRIVFFSMTSVHTPVTHAALFFNGGCFASLAASWCLTSLLGLHVYWFRLIIGVSLRAISNEKEIDDDRSEVDSNSEAEEK